MVEVGTQDLAIYGAIVGTIALSINIFNFVHTKQKDSVRLTVDCVEDELANFKLKILHQTKDRKEAEPPSWVPLYCVIVRNIGNIEAFIQDVGIVDKAGNVHQALAYTNNPAMLVPVSQIKTISIKPKASHPFKVYLCRDQPLFTPKSCFVTDQQGKTWKSKLTLKCLTYPSSP